MRQVRRGAAFRTLRPVQWHPPARLVTLGASPRPRSTMPASADLLKELRIDRSAPPPARDANKRWVFIAIGAGLLAVDPRRVGRAGPRQGDGSGDRAGDVASAARTAAAPPRCSMRPVTSSRAAWRRCRRRSPARCARSRSRKACTSRPARSWRRSIRSTPTPNARSCPRRSAPRKARSACVQAQLKEAEANVVRLNGLVKQQLVAKAQYDQAVAERDALRAQLDTAQRNAQVARRSACASPTRASTTPSCARRSRAW